MSYPRGIDEIYESELLAEIKRRQAARRGGLCDYCQRLKSTTPCKFPERHSREKPRVRLKRRSYTP